MMTSWKYLIGFIALLFIHSNNYKAEAQNWWDVPEELFQWTCAPGGFCQKVAITAGSRATAVGLNTCELTCNAYASIWPRPNSVSFAVKTLTPVDLTQVTVTTTHGPGAIGDLVQAATVRLLGDVSARAPAADLHTGGGQVQVQLDIVDSNQRKLTLATDESYTLTISGTAGLVTVVIQAKNYFGARHGLETLSQLMVYDTVHQQINIPLALTITDKPKFPVRGLMLDTGRSYISVATILRTLDGMASCKMNTFHWHLTDTQSFPYASKRRPDMHKIGAYNRKKIYTPDDVRTIVAYGRVRGIRVLPELDAPAHVGEGWQNYPNNLVVCFDKKPFATYCKEPPCGQINPSQPEVYNVLGDLYADLLDDFDLDMFHMGGDEVSTACWDTEASIMNWAKANGLAGPLGIGAVLDRQGTYMKVWNYFQTTALARFDALTTPTKLPIVLWSSDLTGPLYNGFLDPARYIIQIWTFDLDPTIFTTLARGYKAIISNFDALYLDCGVSAWTKAGQNWCSPYKGWQTIYDNKPSTIAGLGIFINQILGGVAPLWTEQADDATVDARLWPRAAAWAERLWTDPTEDWTAAVSRMLEQRERFVAMGLNPERLQPEWCHQHEDNCPDNGMYNKA